MSKGHEPIELLDYCETTVDICCSKCGTTDTVCCLDDYNAVEEFFKKGWRATLQNCYCPKCAMKYIKGKLKPIKSIFNI
jgi:hypothetical protein